MIGSSDLVRFKRHFIFLGILVLSLTVQAQRQDLLEMSVLVSPQRSWYLNRQVALSKFEYSPTYGTAYGCGITWHFRPTAALVLDVLNSFQGQNYDYVVVDSSVFPVMRDTPYSRRYELTYLKIPIQIQGTAFPGKRISLTARTGIQFSLIQLADYIIILKDTTLHPRSSNFIGQFRTNDLCMVFSAGATVRFLRTMKAGIQCRMDVSLLDADDPGHKAPGLVEPSKNLTLGMMCSLSYVFLTREKKNGNSSQR